MSTRAWVEWAAGGTRTAVMRVTSIHVSANSRSQGGFVRSMPVPQDFILRALDRPARSALELSRRSFLFTLAPAILGLALLAVCAALAAALAHETRMDAL